MVATDPAVPDTIVYKPAGVAETFAIDWSPYFVDSWRPSTHYEVGAIVRPLVGNGFYYECSTAGLSSAIRPAFPAASGETVQDGSVVWTARAPSAVSLESMTASDWTLDDGVTEDSSAIAAGFKATITVSGGVAGEQYRLTNRITKSGGQQEEDSLVLEILDPADV